MQVFSEVLQLKRNLRHNQHLAKNMERISHPSETHHSAYCVLFHYVPMPTTETIYLVLSAIINNNESN